MIDYKYDEDKTLTELKSYIDRTYKEHYSHNKFQKFLQSSLLMVVMVRDFVSVTYSSMHNDMEKRMARIEMTC